jgi:hypothetical protein
VASAQIDDARGAFESHDGGPCTVKTLRGSYLFAASGFNIVGGVAQPKAIHEMVDFTGDGTLTVPGVTLSVNGTITRTHPAAGMGDYTVEPDCSGTLVFSSGPSFDIVVDSDGETVWMFQTNPNTVFQGTATRFDR